MLCDKLSDWLQAYFQDYCLSAGKCGLLSVIKYFTSKGSSTSASGGPGTRKRRMILITLCDALSLD